MISTILRLLSAVDSKVTVSFLNGEGDEKLAALLSQGQKTLTEAQLLVELLAQVMGVELPPKNTNGKEAQG